MRPPPPAGGMPASAWIRIGWHRLSAGLPFACGVAGTPQAIGAVSWDERCPYGELLPYDLRHEVHRRGTRLRCGQGRVSLVAPV